MRQTIDDNRVVSIMLTIILSFLMTINLLSIYYSSYQNDCKQLRCMKICARRNNNRQRTFWTGWFSPARWLSQRSKGTERNRINDTDTETTYTNYWMILESNWVWMASSGEIPYLHWGQRDSRTAGQQVDAAGRSGDGNHNILLVSPNDWQLAHASYTRYAYKSIDGRNK